MKPGWYGRVMGVEKDGAWGREGKNSKVAYQNVKLL